MYVSMYQSSPQFLFFFIDIHVSLSIHQNKQSQDYYYTKHAKS